MTVKCTVCGTEPFMADLVGFAAPVYLSNKRKGIFESELRTSVSCYVCPECGHIGLIADNPKSIMISDAK